jgi:hypothetical protein
VDIAVDIDTQIAPDVFCAHREKGHFKAWSEALSASGHTVYVGSKKSDRYARVYRYFPPHPRSRFLRVEHVLKGEQAKLAASQIDTFGIDAFVTMIGNTFGWKHEIWSPIIDTDESVMAWRPERRQGKTVAWIFKTVIPCMAKLIHDNALDVHEVRAEFAKYGIDDLGF